MRIFSILPPLNLLALDTGAFDADLGTWHGVQAPDAGFRATFSGMRGALPADPTLPMVFEDSTTPAFPVPAAGESLPIPGKALPLEEPAVAPGLAANADASPILEIPYLPGASANHEAGAVPPAPSGVMQAQLLPASGARMPAEALAGASAAAESGSEQAIARTGQATILDHIRCVTPDTGARAPAEVVSIEPSAEVEALPLPHRNPSTISAIREAAFLQPFVQQVAGPVGANAGGEASADALLRVDSQDARPAASFPSPPPAVSTAATPAPSPPLQWPASQVHTSPGQPGWSDALGERVTWMTGNKLHNVELRLNPAELGPVRVQISIDDGNATVNFSAQHPLTRDAIEQALPRLREMLADQGLSLQNANVSEGRGEDQPSPDGHDDLPGPASDRAAPAPQTDEGVLAPTRRVVGLVDLFA